MIATETATFSRGVSRIRARRERGSSTSCLPAQFSKWMMPASADRSAELSQGRRLARRPGRALDRQRSHRRGRNRTGRRNDAVPSHRFGAPVHEPLEEPPADFPLQTLGHESHQPMQPVLHSTVTNSARTKSRRQRVSRSSWISTTAMARWTSLTQSNGRQAVHITFFGGETLMNFPLLKEVVGYATNARRKRAGPSISA